MCVVNQKILVNNTQNQYVIQRSSTYLNVFNSRKGI